MAMVRRRCTIRSSIKGQLCESHQRDLRFARRGLSGLVAVIEFFFHLLDPVAQLFVRVEYQHIFVGGQLSFVVSPLRTVAMGFDRLLHMCCF